MRKGLKMFELASSFIQKTIILVLLALLTACSSKPETPISMSTLVLENGMQVNNCHEYEQMRSVFVIQDSPANKKVSAEYLACSLSLNLLPNPNIDVAMRSIFHGLKLYQLPLSLSSVANKDLSLSSAGFQLWLEKSMLSFGDYQGAEQSIQIQYKGMLKNGNHLIWISDTFENGRQVAYFPAIVMMQDQQVAGAAPLYASGF